MAINRLNPDYPDAGLVQLMPSSVAVGSGSSTTNGNGTVDFSGASSVSLNGVFSSTYDHYRIIGRVFGDANRTIQWRIRSGSTDLTTSTYFFGGTFVGSASNQALASDNNANATSNLVTYVSIDVGTFDMVLYNPFETIRTGYTCNGQGRFATYYAGIVDNTTSYDGITFFPNAGTSTGTIQVYGYRN